MKNVLMIAYHFPPVAGSSGIQRTLKFTQYLLNYGWSAQVLTVKAKVYELINEGQNSEIPKNIVVKRTFALDTARDLSIKGFYFSWMALPDRWVSWCFTGVISGLVLIRKYKPRVIWSTYPKATALLIALILHCFTKIPWVADFRDSMTEDNYPENLSKRKVYRWIEKWTVGKCSRAVFTTQSTLKMYSERYPELPSSKWVLIENGYDEENFVKAKKSDQFQTMLRSKNKDQMVLLHSGLLYPSERDPRPFFKALGDLKIRGKINSSKLKIILRATGHDQLYSPMIKKHNLDDIVFLEPGVEYTAALAEMLVVDALLIFQAANCNHQIPAKLYEYLRSGKPIFALTDISGDTASILLAEKIDTITPLDDEKAIFDKLDLFLDKLNHNKAPIAEINNVSKYSREARSCELAKLLDEF